MKILGWCIIGLVVMAYIARFIAQKFFDHE